MKVLVYYQSFSTSNYLIKINNLIFYLINFFIKFKNLLFCLLNLILFIFKCTILLLIMDLLVFYHFIIFIFIIFQVLLFKILYHYHYLPIDMFNFIIYSFNLFTNYIMDEEDTTYSFTNNLFILFNLFNL